MNVLTVYYRQKRQQKNGYPCDIQVVLFSFGVRHFYIGPNWIHVSDDSGAVYSESSNLTRYKHKWLVTILFLRDIGVVN